MNARHLRCAGLVLAIAAAPVIALYASSASKAETTGATAGSKKSARAKVTKKRVTKAHPLKIPNSAFEALAWHEIKGWIEDDHGEAFSAFLASCKPILRTSEKGRAQRGETYNALFDVCGRAVAALPIDEAGARHFFEQNFRPIKLTASGETDGFFTGYYEPVVEGARWPSDIYTMPLYSRPPNLVTQRLRRSGGKSKAGKRTVKSATAPYYDRTQIEEGALAGRGLEIVWLKDPIDAFFAEIQGSVRVRLEDGKVIRLNYADKNGHPYFAVGSVLIQRGIVTREEISMQKIREFMEKNPDEGKALRRMNRSYVFFRETDLGEHDEAIGAQGISLTAARSIAVDRKIHTYGMPVFVNALLPIVSEKPDTWFRRLMIAQDTGGAIIGPARADIYLGAGDEAARAAGRFKHPGQFVMLIPNELDPENEALGMPLPQPRPKVEESSLVAIFNRPQAKPEEKPEPAPAAAAALPATAAPMPKPDPRSKADTRSQSAARGESKPDAAPKPVAKPAAAPAAKPQLAAQPKLDASSAKPSAKPAESKSTESKPVPGKPDTAAKPRAATGNGNPFPKPISAAPAKPAPKPAAKPSEKASSWPQTGAARDGGFPRTTLHSGTASRDPRVRCARARASWRRLSRRLSCPSRHGHPKSLRPRLWSRSRRHRRRRGRPQSRRSTARRNRRSHVAATRSMRGSICTAIPRRRRMTRSCASCAGRRRKAAVWCW
ncbi:MAG: murein transglycosylase A [Pseudorhodoplanes sp.]